MVDKKTTDDDSPKKWTWIVAMVIVAVIAFSAGYFPFHSTTTSSSSTVNIEFYESVASSEAAFINNTLIPQFETEYPGIHVTFINVGSEGVSKDILALEASGHVGSIVAGQDNLEIGQLIYSSSGNVLMNLTPMAQALMPSSLIPAAANLVNYEKKVFGGVYFFPFRGNVPLVFYNKTMFSNAGIETPPGNYTQLLQDAKIIKSKTGQNAIMIQGASTNGGHTGSSTATELYQMMVQFGGNPLYLNDTGDIMAIQELYNLSSYFSPDFKTGYWGSYHGLAVGNHLLGGDVLFIPKGATNVPALESFIRFLLGAQAQRETLINLSWVAINANAYKDLPASQSVVFTALEQAIATGVFLRNPTPWITEWQVILCNDVFNPVFVTHLKGYSDIPSLLSNAHEAMYQYILTNYGQTNATLYQNPNNYAPISV